MSLVALLAAAQCSRKPPGETAPGGEGATGPQPTYKGKTASEWAALLEDKDPEFRAEVAGVLAERVIAMAPISDSNIGKHAEAVVPALVRRLKDQDAWTSPDGQVFKLRWMAIRTLGNIGTPAKAAVPGLRKALGDRDEDVRKAAQQALEKIQGGR